MDFSSLTRKGGTKERSKRAPEAAEPKPVVPIDLTPLPAAQDAESRASLEKTDSLFRTLIRGLRALFHRAAYQRPLRQTKELEDLRGLGDAIVPLLKPHSDAWMSHFLRSTADDYIYGKLANLAILAARLSIELQENEEASRRAFMTGSLFYIGLAAVPRLDLRPGALSETEKSVLVESVRRSTARFLEGQNEIAGLREAWDSRSPDAQTALAIDRPLLAQIIDAAELFEALCHVRPHRDRLLANDAVKRLIEASDSRFDGAIVKALIQCMSVFPPGSHVELNDGCVARIAAVNRMQPTRPIVRPVIDAAGNLMTQSPLIDLSAHPLVRVKAPVDERTLQLSDPAQALILRSRAWWPA